MRPERKEQELSRSPCRRCGNPRVRSAGLARIDLKKFDTEEILQIRNSAGGHASPFATPDTKYVVPATRFSVPIPQADVPIASYKQNFKVTLTFATANDPGKMDVAFQVMMPGYDYDLGHSGKEPSDG